MCAGNVVQPSRSQGEEQLANDSAKSERSSRAELASVRGTRTHAISYRRISINCTEAVLGLNAWGALVEPRSSFDWVRIKSGSDRADVGEGIPSAGGGHSQLLATKDLDQAKKGLGRRVHAWFTDRKMRSGDRGQAIEEGREPAIRAGGAELSVAPPGRSWRRLRRQ